VKRRAINAFLLVSVLSVVCEAKNKGPEITTRVFDAPIEKVYAAAVQAASANFNLKSAVKEAYTVNFFAAGRYYMVLTAICASKDSNHTEVAVSVEEPVDSPQIFGLRGTREKLRALFWQELQVKLDHMRTSPSSVTPEDKSKASEAFATVTVTSVPEGAEIAIDRRFVGFTPSTLHIPVGDHTLAVASKGYQKWERSMTFRDGESITVRATLDKDQSETAE
jgi:hypothetical protein